MIVDTGFKNIPERGPDSRLSKRKRNRNPRAPRTQRSITSLDMRIAEVELAHLREAQQGRGTSLVLNVSLISLSCA